MNIGEERPPSLEAGHGMWHRVVKHHNKYSKIDWSPRGKVRLPAVHRFRRPQILRHYKNVVALTLGLRMNE
ncbi:hypothetical protein MPTK1_4g15870 [Marchantia polymorpha subsp. ruderalis]|uniref:Uncharacterized protein n=2 Tax=Marchantia polymorpha TaxID=3197 RepID=A0AAF6BAC0_MARPO|nr:hypothetical protein MARPO_0054s0053 [Marchantia polymorpha]BBN08954.1 hypothetical protein Mp_4g15870 [Marchantia polymorpha subsp. ruderalis]|eukprot:PTQ37941.1 hypothetical protein MARPO_0054s0053 [Marchantia polymorpha]